MLPTERRRLCDLYLRDVFGLLCLQRVVLHNPAVLFFFFFFYPEILAWPTPPQIKPWDACNFTLSSVLWKMCKRPLCLPLFE